MAKPMDIFIKRQIVHQYDKEMKTENKRKLDFSPFLDSMEAIEPKRYLELESLILERTLANIQKQVTEGRMTYEELTLFYLKRIKEIDDNKLNSVLQLNPDALKLAKEADLHKHLHSSLLYGMPVLVKDNISTGDKLNNTAGSVAMKELKPLIPAPIIEKLKNAGGIVLGKANMSEWAFYMSTEGVCGYTGLGGQCHNPYGKFGVGGSSSGSAVAVAANLCALSIGTETNGSITNPSGQNSVAGIYPTKGVWSNKEIVPISESLDTPGSMARSIEDAAVLLKALSENEKIQRLEIKDDFKPFRIGVIISDGIVESRREGDELLLKTISEELKSMGMDIKIVLIDDDAFEIDMDPILEFEFSHSVEQYLKDVDHKTYRNLQDIIEIYEKNPESYAPYGYDLLKASVNTELTLEKIMKLEKTNRQRARKSIDDGLKEVDVLMSLSSQFSTVYASAGYPSIIVPAGYRENGEPFGVTFTAGAYEEEKLIHLGNLYERQFQKRKLPEKIGMSGNR